MNSRSGYQYRSVTLALTDLICDGWAKFNRCIKIPRKVCGARLRLSAFAFSTEAVAMQCFCGFVILTSL